jgi:hypothetical protein
MALVNCPNDGHPCSPIELSKTYTIYQCPVCRAKWKRKLKEPRGARTNAPRGRAKAPATSQEIAHGMRLVSRYLRERANVLALREDFRNEADFMAFWQAINYIFKLSAHQEKAFVEARREGRYE